jgi:hypothetical protein
MRGGNTWTETKNAMKAIHTLALIAAGGVFVTSTPLWASEAAFETILPGSRTCEW